MARVTDEDREAARAIALKSREGRLRSRWNAFNHPPSVELAAQCHAVQRGRAERAEAERDEAVSLSKAYADADSEALTQAHARIAELEAELAKAPCSLECPCCGSIAATEPFVDGQPLLCGCEGQVSVDGETEPWANGCDCTCGGLSATEKRARIAELEAHDWIETDRTTNSGKLLFLCLRCGWETPGPTKGSCGFCPVCKNRLGSVGHALSCERTESEADDGE